jgi:hypothetical protein
VAGVSLAGGAATSVGLAVAAVRSPSAAKADKRHGSTMISTRRGFRFGYPSILNCAAEAATVGFLFYEVIFSVDLSERTTGLDQLNNTAHSPPLCTLHPGEVGSIASCGPWTQETTADSPPVVSRIDPLPSARDSDLRMIDAHLLSCYS